jgi:replicative DNA helicase
MGDVAYLEDRRSRQSQEALPPAHDLEAEAALVSAAMLAPVEDDADARAQRARLDRVHLLVSPSMFFEPAKGLVWQAIQGLRASSTPVGLHAVVSWLRERKRLEHAGGREAVALLIHHADRIDLIEAYARRVVEMHERREIAATCLRVQAETRLQVEDHELAKSGWRRELGRVTAPRQALAGRKIGDVARAVDASLREGRSRLVGVRYGLKVVEQRFGLLARGRQHILAGRSEHGKTALACQIAWNVASTPIDATGFGEAVYIVSGEMPAETLLFRSACSLAGVDAQQLELGWVEEHQRVSVTAWLSWLRTLPVIIDEDPAPPEEIARRVQAHQAIFAAGKARRDDDELHPPCRLQFVMGDHLQDLASHAPPVPKERDEMRQIHATARGWVRDIAKKCEVATLLLSQLTRGVADPKIKSRWPVASDLWGGTPVESSADTILAVQRPEILRWKNAAAWEGAAAIVPLKGRMGGSRKPSLLGFYKGKFVDEAPARAVEALEALEEE